jgi:hypothetical protein
MGVVGWLEWRGFYSKFQKLVKLQE